MNQRTIKTEVRDALGAEMFNTLVGLSRQPDQKLPITDDFEMSQQTFVFNMMSGLAAACQTPGAKSLPEPHVMAAALGVLVEWLMQLHLAMYGTEITPETQILGVAPQDRPERQALNKIETDLADQGGYDPNLTLFDINVMNASDQFCRAALFFALQTNSDLKQHLSSVHQITLDDTTVIVFRQAYDKAVAGGKTEFEFEFDGQPVLVDFAKYMLEHYDGSRG
ncbi:hypothetical protein [uncultured Sulfitobacter sp.]|uniref:hypothetical protein n=1 Tax=uncultured Sulfitobacter sp. TaxID=191468 RepID=UPI0025964BE9|nr:hypothetical protein [uncultured Sulfitobacter sp.]